jgi:hypothetical protein
VNVQALREEIRIPVHVLAERLLSSAVSRIDSITIVGSSLTPDFVPGKSDINSVIIIRDDLPGSLDAIAAAGKSLRKGHFAPPLLFTADHISRSLDTFPIELLDFQLNHRTIYGRDPFSGLSFGRKDVRLQCERELKSILFRLSQGYISCHAAPEPVTHLLISAVTSMTSTVRAMLWLKDVDRSGTFEQVFTRTAAAFSVDASPLIEIRKWKAAHRLPSKDVVAGMFPATYELVSRLAGAIDAIEV